MLFNLLLRRKCHKHKMYKRKLKLSIMINNFKITLRIHLNYKINKKKKTQSYNIKSKKSKVDN